VDVRWLWLFGLVYITLLVGLWLALTDEPVRESPAPPLNGQALESPVPPAREAVRQTPVPAAMELVRERRVRSPSDPRDMRRPVGPAPTVPSADWDARPPARFDPTVQHTIDPCMALAEPITPEDYNQMTVAGATVAWNPAVETDVFSFRPLSIAHLVGGVLDEAAQLTGTEPRTQLTVIVDASPEDFRARTRAPAKVRGFYDGGAVRLPGGIYPGLGIALTTLRHETMHAQLHAGVGCLPRWFHEGLATYFGGEPPVREWFAMLRSGESFDIAALNDPTGFDPMHPGATRLYAVAAAMIVYIVQHRGEQALQIAVRAAKARDPSGEQRISPSQLWGTVAPGAGYRDVLDKLAERIFGIATGVGLDTVLRGPLCCVGWRNLGALSCRATQPRGSEASWRDTASVPAALCRARWDG